MDITVRMAALMLAAMVTENIVFGRAIGIIVEEKRPKQIFSAGLLLALVVTVSCAAAAVIAPLVPSEKRIYVEPIVYTTLISVIYFIIYALVNIIGLKKGVNTAGLCRMLAAAVFNSTVFGVVLIVTRRLYSPLDAVFYGLGASAGYTAAMLLIRRQRHQESILRVPKAFKGLPITLIYIGIISLALYGLIGHQLTA